LDHSAACCDIGTGLATFLAAQRLDLGNVARLQAIQATELWRAATRQRPEQSVPSSVAPSTAAIDLCDSGFPFWMGCGRSLM
jgi:hypothetical protein